MKRIAIITFLLVFAPICIFSGTLEDLGGVLANAVSSVSNNYYIDTNSYRLAVSCTTSLGAYSETLSFVDPQKYFSATNTYTYWSAKQVVEKINASTFCNGFVKASTIIEKTSSSTQPYNTKVKLFCTDGSIQVINNLNTTTTVTYDTSASQVEWKTWSTVYGDSTSVVGQIKIDTSLVFASSTCTATWTKTIDIGEVTGYNRRYNFTITYYDSTSTGLETNTYQYATGETSIVYGSYTTFTSGVSVNTSVRYVKLLITQTASDSPASPRVDTLTLAANSYSVSGDKLIYAIGFDTNKHDFTPIPVSSSTKNDSGSICSTNPLDVKITSMPNVHLDSPVLATLTDSRVSIPDGVTINNTTVTVKITDDTGANSVDMVNCDGKKALLTYEGAPSSGKVKPTGSYQTYSESDVIPMTLNRHGMAMAELFTGNDTVSPTNPLPMSEGSMTSVSLTNTAVEVTSSGTITLSSTYQGIDVKFRGTNGGDRASVAFNGEAYSNMYSNETIEVDRVLGQTFTNYQIKVDNITSGCTLTIYGWGKQ